ncbi:histidinol-phosphate aminotransferase family protein [Flavihumibacter rivuli]|uniref:pyridoxal phosphate-dependent aminotransferase n=1 Tax=Flavihumibacter rivuli TaxID=2838156 RepID=UPI001BDEACB7|nr:histidinol-phosphate transaminase [Flavihumibacter rivuli]ULQ57258.1 histidinol-phosphate aminotransferase family protein [Flavihumibacter rivuli]
MSNPIARREWLKQSALAAFGLSFSFKSLGGEDYLPRYWGSEQGLLNLGSNENPYGLSPAAKQAIADMINSAHRYQYNIPSLQNFKKELATFYGVTPDHLLVTPGSGEALNLLARAYSQGDLVTANPTFGILPNTAKKIGVNVKEIALDGAKVHDLGAMMKAIDTKTSHVYICNPANPTGTVLKPAELRQFCQEASKQATVTIDEAYIDFLDAPYNESMVSLINDNKNIVIVRTFSKIHAMAGMRVGFVMAHPDTIKALAANHFNNANFCMSALSMTAAQASLKDLAHSKLSKEKNAAARDFTISELEKLGFRCTPSFTNFIFFNLRNYQGDFAKDMLAKNVLLRSSEQPDGKYCRVSVGTMEEMQSFIKLMKAVKA